MKKGDICEGIVESVLYPNRGRMTADEETITVKNCIPGQRVQVRINKKRAGRLEGQLIEALEASPLETREALCPVFPGCGGCMYQTMDYQEQLSMKETQLKELFSPVAAADGQDLDACWEGIIASPRELGYRNKMEFTFGDEYKGGPLVLGLHKKASNYDIAEVTACAICPRDMSAIVRCTVEYFRELGTPFYHRVTHNGYLRHLMLREGARSGEILIHLVTTSQEEHDLSELVERLFALPLDGKIAGILHLINDSLADVVRADETRILYGQDHFYEEMCGLRFKISSFSFFQPNTLAAEKMYEKVRQYVAQALSGSYARPVVYDLYSGTGTIAQVLAPAAREVIGVEIVEEAVRAARENATANGLDNCRFLVGDVFQVLDEITEKPDVIILDPPRDGIHPKALPRILAYDVPTIVYISCQATSLARDLPAFFAAGYRIRRMCAVDQFCETVAVETVCFLDKQVPARDDYTRAIK